MARGKLVKEKKSAPTKVKANSSSFTAQANLDFPFRTYEDTGRKHYATLTERHKKKQGGKKLVGYDLFLLEKHFPILDKKFIAEREKADAKRKAARRSAHQQTGLEVVTSDSETPVFSRKATQALTMQHCCEYVINGLVLFTCEN
jgi:hypothetical protein